MKLQELMVQRANIIAQARAIVDKADEEKRDLTEEEKRNFDQAFADADKLREEIERRQKLEQAERDLAQSATKPMQRIMVPGSDNGNARVVELRKLFPNQSDEWIQAEVRHEALFPRVLPAFLSGDYRMLGPEETRALQQDLQASGGYLVPPMQFVRALIQAVDNMVFMRQWATKNDVMSADSLGVASLDNDPADPTWVAELNFGSEDSTMTFGRRELHPHPLAKYIKVSKKLIRTVPSVETIVRDRLAYKFAVAEESAFLTGTGANQPLGVFVASANGINTDRDVSTGNEMTLIKFDGLYEAKYTLKQQYWARARWLFHRDAVKQIAKLKDGEGRYIWAESQRVGEPDRLLGLPVYMSEYVPNTFTTGLYVGILGDFSYYWIADALTMEIEVLRELYAATNQVAIVARKETDGMPVLSEAFVRVKLA